MDEFKFISLYNNNYFTSHIDWFNAFLPQNLSSFSKDGIKILNQKEKYWVHL